MSSLRPESNKVHSLGTDSIRWKKLSVGGINADEQVIIDNTTDTFGLIVTGSMSLKEGDISLWDNNTEYKVLETLLDLSAGTNIDETNLVHKSGTETISGFKTFTGGLQLTKSSGVTFKIAGDDLDPTSNDGTIPTTKWVNDKLSDITIANATTSASGKVRLATSDDMAGSGTNTDQSSNPIVVQPSQVISKVNTAVQGIAGGLIYKGAIDIVNSLILQTSITSSLSGDFWYVKTGGTVSISNGSTNENVTFNVGNIVIFKSDATNPILTTQFDVIQNALNFEQIKGVLESGNTSNIEYYANSLYSKGIIGATATDKYDYTDLLNTTGLNTAESNASYDFSTNPNVTVTVKDLSFDVPLATDAQKKQALNVNSLENYLDNNLSIDKLKDVQTTNAYIPSHGQFLMWSNDTNSNPPSLQKWIPQTLPTITTTLSGLEDTLILSPTNNQALVYDSTAGKWKNSSSLTLPDTVAYTSASSPPQNFINENTFTGGLTATKQLKTTSGQTVTWSGFADAGALANQHLGNPAYRSVLYSTSSFGNNIVTTNDWVTRKSLKRAVTTDLTSNIDLQTALLSNTYGMDDSKNNYPIFNDFIWTYRPDGVATRTITLPSCLNSSPSPAFLKTGFTLNIKNIPQGSYSTTTTPENYIINISPQLDQYIDGVQNDIIQLVPYSSITFVVSDDQTVGWVII
jgi:hypothetical protein